MLFLNKYLFKFKIQFINFFDEEKIVFFFSKYIPIIISNTKKYSFNKASKILSEINEYHPSSIIKEYDIYSILGNIKAMNNSYIVCAYEVKYIGTILEANIYKIKKFTYIPIQGSEIIKEDVKYLKMLDDFLSRNNLYYSDKLDLTI